MYFFKHYTDKIKSRHLLIYLILKDVYVVLKHQLLIKEFLKFKEILKQYLLL